MSKILVVDDEKSIRLTLRAILQDAGYEVEIAEDGIVGVVIDVDEEATPPIQGQGHPVPGAAIEHVERHT